MDRTPDPGDLNTRSEKTFPDCGPDYAFVRGWRLPARNRSGRQHDEHVTQMNEVRVSVSAQVQRRTGNVASMIEEPGHPTGHLQIP